MSIWIRILNWSFQFSLHTWTGFQFKVCEMGLVLRLGCFSAGLIWDTSGLLRANQQQEAQEVR